MSLTPIGDLAQHLQTRSRSAHAQAELQRLSAELSSGRKHDLSKALRGNFAELTNVERGLRLTQVYTGSAEAAGAYFATMQTSLQSIEDHLGSLSTDLMATATLGQIDNIRTVAMTAEDSFALSVATLNNQIAGRSAFSGTATDQPALISSEAMLTELETALVGVPDVATMLTIVDDWFQDPAGGYETMAYLGSTDLPHGFAIAEGETARAEFTALDPAFRTTLSGLALATLIHRGIGPVDLDSVSELGQAAGSRMLTGQDQIIDKRAEIGVVEERIETALTRHRAAETAYGLEENRLIAADPFETATELQSVEAQLDTLYMLTARLSRLSLAEYL